MAQSAHTPGEPPPIRDEAADTPMWVPLAGLALLVVGSLFVLWRAAGAPDPDAVAVETAAAGADVAEADAADGDEAGAEADDEADDE